MDNQRVIASTLTDNELAQAFTDLVAERWDKWDLSPYLAYLPDICDASVLPYLADQMDVDGLREFVVADNEQQQRDLIKRSIALHKFMGTPWAIRESCRTVGFPVIVLEEGITALDNIVRPDDWARFRLYLRVFDTRKVMKRETRKLRSFIDIYKNERSHLVDFGLYQILTEKPIFTLDEEKDEHLDVFITQINPNPVIINPRGELITVSVNCNVEWEIGSHTGIWEDETGNQYEVTKTGEQEISIISDKNETGDREIFVPLLNEEGLLLDILHIIQHLKWHNAYSHAYSSAYNWRERYKQ